MADKFAAICWRFCVYSFLIGSGFLKMNLGFSNTKRFLEADR